MALLLPLSCLPMDDLATYSSEWERQTREVASILPLDASPPADSLDGGGTPDSPALDASAALDPAAVDAGPRLDAGGSPALDDAGADALDAGTATDAAAAP